MVSDRPMKRRIVYDHQVLCMTDSFFTVEVIKTLEANRFLLDIALHYITVVSVPFTIENYI